MPQEFTLPSGIDPDTPASQLTFEQITAICVAAAPLLGFSVWTPETRAAHGQRVSAGRLSHITPKQRREIAQGAARARWGKTRAK
jgi:hypothetical protein